MSDPRWAVVLDPPVLLPGRPVAVSVSYTPDRDLAARGVRVTLRCQERYRYTRTEGTGKTAHRAQ